MANERWDYVTLRPVMDPVDKGRLAYNEGEGIMAQVVEDLGLEVGVDVRPARADSMPQPAGNASRVEWAKYAAIQASVSGEPTQEEIDGMTRDQLRDYFTVADEDDADEDVADAEPVEDEEA